MNIIKLGEVHLNIDKLTYIEKVNSYCKQGDKKVYTTLNIYTEGSPVLRIAADNEMMKYLNKNIGTEFIIKETKE